MKVKTRTLKAYTDDFSINSLHEFVNKVMGWVVEDIDWEENENYDRYIFVWEKNKRNKSDKMG